MVICPHCERSTDSDPCSRCGGERAQSPGALGRTYSVGTLAVITVVAIALSSVARAGWQLYTAFADDRASEARLGVLVSQIQAAAAILVVVWLWRSMKNIEAFPGKHEGLGPGWAIGAWFVPVAQVWLPFQVMRQVAAGEQRGRWVLPSIVAWWACFLATSAMGIRISLQGAYQPSLADATVAGGTYVLSGIALCVLVFTIGRAQQDRIDRALARRAAVKEPRPSAG